MLWATYRADPWTKKTIANGLNPELAAKAGNGPEETEKVFCGERIIETGIKHGTVTVIIDDMPLEITTYQMCIRDSRNSL